jgi:integral membrane protein (TIGR01906 family)
MKRKNLLKITLIISIVSLIIVIFLSSFAQLAFNKEYYLSLQRKHGVYETLGENQTVNMTENVVGFLQGKNDLAYFSDDEKSHMQDVKGVFNNLFGIFYPSLFIFIVCFVMIIYLDKKDALHSISEVFVYAGGISILILIIFFLLSINFSDLFMNFHKVFFPQGNYLFPRDSLLLKLFPEGFFKDFAIRIFVYSAIKAGILLAIGLSPPSGLAKHKARAD